jgi:predicted enzyme related to lactoylglutathione lyase
VLGWQFAAGHVDDGWQIEDVAPMGGIGGGAAELRTLPMWRVDDIASAVERVRAAGGTATAPERQPYGITSECVDDQGMQFYLGQL